MPTIRWWATLSVSAAANGGSGSVSYVPTEDVLIKRIFCTERAAQNLQNVFCEITFEGEDLTKGAMPMAIIGSDSETALPIDKVLHKGNSIVFDVTNYLSTAVTVDIVLECEKPPA